MILLYLHKLTFLHSNMNQRNNRNPEILNIFKKLSKCLKVHSIDKIAFNLPAAKTINAVPCKW